MFQLGVFTDVILLNYQERKHVAFTELKSLFYENPRERKRAAFIELQSLLYKYHQDLSCAAILKLKSLFYKNEGGRYLTPSSRSAVGRSGGPPHSICYRGRWGGGVP